MPDDILDDFKEQTRFVVQQVLDLILDFRVETGPSPALDKAETQVQLLNSSFMKHIEFIESCKK